MGIPISTRGNQILFSQRGSKGRLGKIETAIGPVITLLEVIVEPDVHWERAPEPAVADEGDSLFFI